MGYTRHFHVHTNSAVNHACLDEDARVFVSEQPDAAGNVCSPMSKCFDALSFGHCLQELALVAESSNCRLQVVTQQRAPATSSEFGLFDSEARGIQSDLNTEANRSQVTALAGLQGLGICCAAAAAGARTAGARAEEGGAAACSRGRGARGSRRQRGARRACASRRLASRDQVWGCHVTQA
jgi:hypothetical protein